MRTEQQRRPADMVSQRENIESLVPSPRVLRSGVRAPTVS